MAMPRFTADSSAYRSVRRYAVTARRPGGDQVVPAERLYSTCGSCNCEVGTCCRLSLFGCECYTCGTESFQTRQPVFRSA